MTFVLVCKASSGTSWAVEKSLACQKICRWYCEIPIRDDIVCPICFIVRPSWGHLVPSCGLRFCFVWSSMSSDILRHTKTLWRKREGRSQEFKALLGCTHGVTGVLLLKQLKPQSHQSGVLTAFPQRLTNAERRGARCANASNAVKTLYNRLERHAAAFTLSMLKTNAEAWRFHSTLDSTLWGLLERRGRVVSAPRALAFW